MQVLQLDDVPATTSTCCARSRAEVDALFQDLLIGVTNFFRDPEAFEALEQRRSIPQLLQGKGADDSVRVWVAGLRDRRGGLLASPSCCASRRWRTARSAAAADLRHRHRRAGARRPATGAIPARSPTTCRRERLRAVLHARGRRRYRVARRSARCAVLGAQPDQGPAVLAARPDRLPQPADLSRAATLQERLIAAVPLSRCGRAATCSSAPSETSAGTPTCSRRSTRSTASSSAAARSARRLLALPLPRRGGRAAPRDHGAPRADAERERLLQTVAERALLEQLRAGLGGGQRATARSCTSPAATGRYLEPPAGEPTLTSVSMARKGLRARAARRAAPGGRETGSRSCAKACRSSIEGGASAST